MSKNTTKTTSSVGYNGIIPATPLRFILYVSRRYKWLAIGSTVAVLVAKTAELAAIYAISRLVDNFGAAVNTDQQLDVLMWGGAAVLIFGVLDRIAWRTSGFLGITWLINADADAYRELYQYTSNHSQTYFSDRFAGAISNKISNAAGGVGDLIVRILWDILPHLVSLFVIFWMFMSIHWLMALILFSFMGSVFAFNVWRVRRRRPLVVTYADASSRFRGHGVDLITNIQAARQYVRRKEEMDRLDEIISERVGKDFKQAYHGEWTMVFNGMLGILLLAVVITGSYLLLDQGSATAGEVVLVLLLLGQIGYSFNVMGQLMNSFIRRYAEIEEGLDEVLVDYEITDTENAKKLKVIGGEVAWKNVLFTYDSNKVFNNFNLTIKPGERVGLVGPSGAGKTTFVSLLLRQHDIDAGEISVDGQNIAEVTQDSLREHIAVVPQEPMLFHRSIRENIAYGKPKATKKEIEEVSKKAQALGFITTLPEGFDTLVGERGVKLSGGQKQRVAIARAMLKDAPVLVLDEATSALDSESEVAIQKALHKLMEGKTVVAIAHRLSTLREMDRILVLENGKIVEDGNHEALAKAGGTYQKLWEHQAGGFLQD